MRQKSGTQFNCFSPPVMLATLIVEGLLAIYTLWRYRLTVVTRLIVAAVLALAVFQLAEFHVCTGFGLAAEHWSRLGFVAITLLPPLGLHILHQLADKPRRRLVYTAYASMAVFVAYFILYRTAFIGYQCTGNYVIFQIGLRPALAYGLYYYGWLAIGIGLGAHWANQLMKSKLEAARQQLQTVRALIIGYLIFLVPTALANSVKPSTRRGIPSIMCGFAVLFALILVIYILPRVGKTRRA